MKDQRKIPRLAKNSVEYTVPNKINKPRRVPPRTSLDPIPTPRKSTLTRSRDSSREKEPYYKVPPANPVPVKQTNHLYADPIYKQDEAKSAKRTVLTKQASYATDESNTSDQSDDYAVIEIKDKKVKEHTGLHHRKESVSKQNDRRSKKERSPKQENPSKPDNRGKEIKSDKRKDHLENYPEVKVKESSKPKENRNQSNDTDLKKNDSHYEHKVDKHKNSDVRKTNDLDRKQKLEQKQSPRAFKQNGKDLPVKAAQMEKQSDENIKKDPNPYDHYSTYTPVEMPMKPDWFDMKPVSKDVPRQKSIIDGVLYTSRGLMEDSAASQTKPIAFNLIKPEIFELYDVCRNHPKLQTPSSEQKPATDKEIYPESERKNTKTSPLETDRELTGQESKTSERKQTELEGRKTKDFAKACKSVNAEEVTEVAEVTFVGSEE